MGAPNFNTTQYVRSLTKWVDERFKKDDDNVVDDDKPNERAIQKAT